MMSKVMDRMENVTLNDGILSIDGKKIELPFPCGELLCLSGLIIARIEPEIGKIFNRNVFCLDHNGNTKWQIAESPHGLSPDKPYTSIFIDENGCLVAGNWIGVDYFVDLNDGSISTKSLTK